MLIPDFSDRTYTAEVLRTRANASDALKAILRLTREYESEAQVDDDSGLEVNVLHRHWESERVFHRSVVKTVRRGDQEVELPRTRSAGTKRFTLYDVFVAQCGHHIVVAVPFHDMAEHFFLRVDRTLAGTRTVYEKLDITNMVINLGASGVAKVARPSSAGSVSISVTRCHLVYKDRENRSANLQQIRMTGANLGASEQYKPLVAPVLDKASTAMTVTPVVLGFALSTDDVKKSSATTDRHGNFKLWMGAGVRRLFRLFSLLGAIEGLENVTSTTSNIPILQSKTIRDAED